MLLTVNAPLRSGKIALTFDDVPVFGAFAPAADGASVAHQLLDGFARRRWHVTGFVNEIQLEGPDKLQRTALLER